MRWLLISRQHHPSHGGIGTYVLRFLSAAKAAGWHVELMTQPGNAVPECARVHHVATTDMHKSFEARLPDLRRRQVVRPYRYALWSKAVAERLLRIDGEFDAIEFVDCQAEGFAALGCPAVRERHSRAAFIVHAHTPMFVEEFTNGAELSAFGRPTYHAWERRALQMADGVIVTAGVMRDAIDDIAASTVIPYPIEAGALPEARSRQSRILLIGSVQPRKGPDIWTRSLGEVLRVHPRATAMLIGPDTPTAPDGSSMAAFVQRLIDPRVRDRFQWTGSIPHERVRELIATSALVVVPSRFESFSFVAAEALSAGTPVIVSDRTGIAEHVPSLPRAPNGDVAALAGAQTDALWNPDESLRRMQTCRAEMLWACAPSRVLRMRAQWLVRIRRRAGNHRAETIAGDTLDEVSAFVASVDAGESVDSRAFASSATS